MTKPSLKTQKQKPKRYKEKPKNGVSEDSRKIKKGITDEEMISLRILINHIIRRQKP